MLAWLLCVSVTADVLLIVNDYKNGTGTSIKQAIQDTDVEEDAITSITIIYASNVQATGIDTLFSLRSLRSLTFEANCSFAGDVFNPSVQPHLETVIIEAALGKIAENVFSCSNLFEFSAPKVREVGDGCFQGCRSLEIVNLDNCATIGAQCFVNCPQLVSVSCQVGVAVGAEAFSNCFSLGAPPNTVVSIGNSAFANCKALSVSRWSAVTSLGRNVFENCGVTSLTFDKLEELDVAALGGCSIESLYLTSAKWITNNDNVRLPQSLQRLEAQAIEELPSRLMFQCCDLHSVVMGSLGSVSPSMFEYCVSLRDVKLPMVKSVGDYAFSHCFSLVALPETPKVINFASYAFESCSGIATIDSKSLEEAGECCFRGCTALQNVSLPNLIRAGEGALCETKAFFQT